MPKKLIQVIIQLSATVSILVKQVRPEVGHRELSNRSLGAIGFDFRQFKILKLTS